MWGLLRKKAITHKFSEYLPGWESSEALNAVYSSYDMQIAGAPCEWIWCFLSGITRLLWLCLHQGPYFSAFTKAVSMEIHNVQLKMFCGSTDEMGRVFPGHVPQMCVVTCTSLWNRSRESFVKLQLVMDALSPLTELLPIVTCDTSSKFRLLVSVQRSMRVGGPEADPNILCLWVPSPGAFQMVGRVTW